MQNQCNGTMVRLEYKTQTREQGWLQEPWPLLLLVTPSSPSSSGLLSSPARGGTLLQLSDMEVILQVATVMFLPWTRNTSTLWCLEEAATLWCENLRLRPASDPWVHILYMVVLLPADVLSVFRCTQIFFDLHICLVKLFAISNSPPRCERRSSWRSAVTSTLELVLDLLQKFKDEMLW